MKYIWLITAIFFFQHCFCHSEEEKKERSKDEYVILECTSTIYEDPDIISFDHFLIYNTTLEKYEVYDFIHHTNYIWPIEKILEYLPHMTPIDDIYFDFYKKKFKYFYDLEMIIFHEDYDELPYTYYEGHKYDIYSIVHSIKCECYQKKDKD